MQGHCKQPLGNQTLLPGSIAYILELEQFLANVLNLLNLHKWCQDFEKEFQLNIYYIRSCVNVLKYYIRVTLSSL